METASSGTIPPAYDQPDENVETPTAIASGPREDIAVTAVQRLVVSELNALRGRDTPTVFEDPRLSGVAQRKSIHMAKHGYFGHERPDGGDTLDWVGGTGYDCVNFGETLLKTYWKQPLTGLNGTKIQNESTLADHIVTSLARSPSHRAILVDSEYRTTGVGLYVTDDGTVYVTILMCN